MKMNKMTAAVIAAGLLITACGGNTDSSQVRETDSRAADNSEKSSEAPAAVSESGGDISGEITVASYDSARYRAFLEEAAKLYEAEHPGTRINLDSFSEMPEIKQSSQDGEEMQIIEQQEDPQGRADYISQTSTALMSGSGADLLAMDVLPLEKYVEMGQLKNLQAYMEGDPEFVRTDYRSNILNGLSLQNGIWYLPLNYSFDYYAYDSTLMDPGLVSEFGMDQSFATTNLLDMVQPAYDGSSRIISAPAYLAEGNGDLFSRLFREQYPAFINTAGKTANFEDGQFEALLNWISDLSAQGLIAKGIEQSLDPAMMLESADDAPENRFLLKSKNQFSLISQTYPEPGLNLVASTSGVSNGIEKDDEIAGIWSEVNGIVPFTYEQAFGINANSTNKALAWDFLKFMLSYEIQSSPGMSYIGLPLHNQARLDKAKNLYTSLLTENGELNEIQTQALAAYTEAVETMSDQINGITIRDTAIVDMVIKEAGYYFDGTKTAKEVCSTLQNKAGLYLNE